MKFIVTIIMGSLLIVGCTKTEQSQNGKSDSLSNSHSQNHDTVGRNTLNTIIASTTVMPPGIVGNPIVVILKPADGSSLADNVFMYVNMTDPVNTEVYHHVHGPTNSTISIDSQFCQFGERYTIKPQTAGVTYVDSIFVMYNEAPFYNMFAAPDNAIHSATYSFVAIYQTYSGNVATVFLGDSDLFMAR